MKLVKNQNQRQRTLVQSLQHLRQMTLEESIQSIWLIMRFTLLLHLMTTLMMMGALKRSNNVGAGTASVTFVVARMDTLQ